MNTKIMLLSLLTIPLLMLGFASDDTKSPDAYKSTLGQLQTWDDGLAEMCYYDATKSIYGKQRKYTRVHIFVRQWNDRDTGVKTSNPKSATAVPVFKFNIAEEIPTENYNYRFLTMLFQHRSTLAPQKLVVSSQEWCGATFKHLRWKDNSLVAKQFSYFESEADTEEKAAADVWPFAASFAIAREFAATGKSPTIRAWLPPLRSTHGSPLREITDWEIMRAQPTQLRVPAGTFRAVKVTIHFGKQQCQYWIESNAPYRLLKFDGFDESFALRGVETRAYWDQDWSSKHHKPNNAP